MDTKGPSFFIVSSSNLQIIRTAIKSWTSWNSGHIHPLTSELPARECQKICCGHDSAFSLDWIFISLVDNEDRHKILNEVDSGSDKTICFGVTCP